MKGNSNSSGNVIQSSDADILPSSKPFYARFLYGKIQELYVDKSGEENVALLNLQRGIVSQFQVFKLY